MNTNLPYQNQPRFQQQPMAQYRIVDERHRGLVVSIFAHPSEWKAGSKVVWNMEATNLPALVYAITFNPEGVESFEFLPTQAYFWGEIDYGIVPIGQSRHGLMRMPPRSGPEALVQLVIPQFRGDRQNLRVLGVHPVANLWQATNDPPPQQQAEGVVARVEYEEHGRAIEEEFYGVCTWIPVSGGMLNWGFGRLFCFRAERGQLDHLRETFWQIAGSLQPNPQWAQLYEQITQQLMYGVMVREQGKVDEIFRYSEMGRRNIIENDRLIVERSAAVADSVAQQQEINHQQSQYPYTQQDALNDAITGRTAFNDPNSAVGNYHYVEGNPLYTWTDGQGGWHSTNDPMDNPNHHKNGNWTLAQQVTPGS